MRYQKNFRKLSANSLAIITKQEIKISCIEQISIKSGTKKIKYYQISKKILQAFNRFSGHDHKTAN